MSNLRIQLPSDIKVAIEYCNLRDLFDLIQQHFHETNKGMNSVYSEFEERLLAFTDIFDREAIADTVKGQFVINARLRVTFLNVLDSWDKVAKMNTNCDNFFGSKIALKLRVCLSNFLSYCNGCSILDESLLGELEELCEVAQQQFSKGLICAMRVNLRFKPRLLPISCDQQDCHLIERFLGQYKTFTFFRMRFYLTTLPLWRAIDKITNIYEDSMESFGDDLRELTHVYDVMLN